MRPLFLLAAPLLLAACDGREVTAICASKGVVGGTLETAFHDAGGQRILRRQDDAGGATVTLRDTLSDPILTDLWRLAETSMRSLPESEPSPCNLDTEASVTVIYSDGTRLTRRTTCEGNALDRVATGILQASEPARLDGAAPDPDGAAPLDGIAAACEALP